MYYIIIIVIILYFSFKAYLSIKIHDVNLKERMGSCFSKDHPQTTCVVCFNKATTVLYPCGHFCLCQNCGEELSRRDTSQFTYIKFNYKDRGGMKCPMCRRKGLPAIVYQNVEQ